MIELNLKQLQDWVKEERIRNCNSLVPFFYEGDLIELSRIMGKKRKPDVTELSFHSRDNQAEYWARQGYKLAWKHFEEALKGDE